MKVRAKALEEKREHGAFLSIVKGSLIALCVSMIGVLIFAFCLKFTSLSDKLITPINQVIKGISIFLGVFFGLRKRKDKGLVCGLMIGLIYTLAAFLVFSLLNASFVFDLTLVYDMIFGTLIGGICGIITINVKKTTR